MQMEVEKTRRKRFLGIFLIIVICWLPWLIAYYPASMDNDVFRQLAEGLGIWAKTNHHPWFSTQILMLFFKMGVHLGNENIGIFLYVLARAILMALIYTDSIVTMRRIGIDRRICRHALAFFAITPVWGAYAKHAFKDTFAAAAFCWFITLVIKLIYDIRNSNDGLITHLKLGASSLLCALFRNNYIYCVLPVAVLLTFYFFKKRVAWKKRFLVIGITMLYFMYHYLIIHSGGVIQEKAAEALSLPLQMVARTAKYESYSFSTEEMEMFNSFFSEADSIGEIYNPIISDPVKARFRGNATTFLKYWAKGLIKHPSTYYEATIAQTYGYYAFTTKFEYYEGNWNSGLTIFDWIGSNKKPLDGYYEFKYSDSLETARQVLDKWADIWNVIPILSLTVKIPVYTWLLVIIAYLVLKQKNKAMLIPVVGVAILVLTCIASPVNGAFRYYAPVAASFPVLLCTLKKKECAQVQRER